MVIRLKLLLSLSTSIHPAGSDGILVWRLSIDWTTPCLAAGSKSYEDNQLWEYQNCTQRVDWVHRAAIVTQFISKILPSNRLAGHIRCLPQHFFQSHVCHLMKTSASNFLFSSIFAFFLFCLFMKRIGWNYDLWWFFIG